MNWQSQEQIPVQSPYLSQIKGKGEFGLWAFTMCVFYSKSTKVIMSWILDTLAAELDFFDGSLFTWIEKLVNLFSKTFVIFLSSFEDCINPFLLFVFLQKKVQKVRKFQMHHYQNASNQGRQIQWREDQIYVSYRAKTRYQVACL